MALADPKTPKSVATESEPQESDHDELSLPKDHETADPVKNVKLGGLVYNIQIVLPETRDPKVYDAFFRSFKEHLYVYS